jgi:hypothetical protein
MFGSVTADGSTATARDGTAAGEGGAPMFTRVEEDTEAAEGTTLVAEAVAPREAVAAVEEGGMPVVAESASRPFRGDRAPRQGLRWSPFIHCP